MLQPTRLISTPFAQEGEKTEIQNVTGEFDNSATYRLGFPPLTMQSIRLGGKPPKGTDFNGVLFDITENISFLCKGGRYQYNAGLSTLIGGYPEGSNLLLDDNVTEVVSTVAGNQNNPNTDMTGWTFKPNRTTAVNVADASGETQQQVNYNGGSKWHSRDSGYLENERVVLANGNIVKSTIDGNANDPNVDMFGWVDTLDATFVVDGNENQHQLNTEFKKSQHIEAHSIADIASLNEPTDTKLTLHAGRRSGEFTIKSSSDQIVLDKTRTDAPLFTLAQAAALDTFNAVFIQTETGVAVRDIGYSVEAGWFGVTYDWNHATQTGTDDTEKLRAAMYFAAAWKLPLSTDSGAIRTTSQLVSQKDGYWKHLTWESNNTEVIADHAGSGMRCYGGAYKFTQRGNLTFLKSDAFKTTGGNSFPDLTDLVTYSATKNYGVVFDGNQHDVENITASGFNAGVIFYISEFNMNHSKHNVCVTENDIGALVFGPFDDASVIETEITAFENFQEGVYVKPGVNFRQWVGRIRAENNLKDRITNPAIAGRYAVYIGHHIACDLWCYVEQYEYLTPGAFELYVSDTGASTIFSARKNTDYIRGNNTAQSGNTLYQHFYVGNPTARQATPLQLQGFGVRLNDPNDFVEMPIVADDTKYGSVRGQAGRIGLHSQNATNSVTVSDGNVQLGKSFNGIFTDEVALSSASPTFSQLIKTLYLSNEASIGTLTVIGSSNDPTYGYIPYILKVDFYINGGVVTLNNASRMYFNNSEGQSSANIRQDGSNVYLDLAYNPAWHGSNYYFKYKLELISAIR